ncbi:hypothetical protein GCM10027345_05250 [Hymenobacter daeguensis]
MELYALTAERSKEAYTLKTIADMHLVLGNYALAREELLQALAKYRKIHYPWLHYTFDLLVPVDMKLGLYQEALGFQLAAIESAKATHDTGNLVYFYLRAALLYAELNQKRLNLDFQYKALALAEKNKVFKNNQNPVYVAHTIAKTLVDQHQPQQALALFQKECRAFPPTNAYTRLIATQGFGLCYLATKQYALAEQYARQGVQLAEANRQHSTQLSAQQYVYKSNLLLSKVYMATRRYDAGRLLLNKVLSSSSQFASVKELSAIHLLLFKADSAQGHFTEALKDYQHFKTLNDSIFSERNSKLIAGLQIRYDTEKREHRLALLTKKNVLQQSQIRQRELQRNGFLAGTLLLALLLGVSYNRYRLKQRNNQLLEKKQLEINQKNQALEQVVSEKELLLVDKDQLLEDKEWMLKEIHHRVKNNLQIITSLLHSQTIYLTDKAALSAIRESQNRVQSMALIHQKLYQGTQLASVPMQAYVLEIANYLIASFDSQRFVRAELAVADVELDVSLAVPVGLILNEAITNSLKYAFPARQAGIIRIELTRSVKTYVLNISDNGVGLPADFNPQRSRTLGLSLIRGLSKQIDGRLRIDGQQGVRITLAFDDVEAVTRASRPDARVLAQD